MKPRAAIFFDRDGIVNLPPSPEEYYVKTPDRFFLLPGFTGALRVIREAGWPVVIITNQQCVAKGLVSPQTLDAIHEHMHRLLAAEGLSVDAVEVCPHSDEDACVCKKPKPGMLLRAAARLDLDLSASWMIGDQPRDCEAGKAAGCHTVLVSDHHHSAHADLHIASILELPALLHARILSGSPRPD